MATSKLQRRTSLELSKHFSQFTIRENTRPSWMVDETGQALELDFFIEELDIAIEVQGDQHYVFVPRFHGDKQGYYDQLRRDRLKREACEKRGIILYEVDTVNMLEIVVDKILMWIELSEYTGYMPLDSRIKMWWNDLVTHTSDPEYRRASYFRVVNIVRQLIETISRQPELLTNIHPKIARGVIEQIKVGKAYIDRWAETDANSSVDIEADYKLYRKYKKWRSGYRLKGGAKPTIDDYNHWLVTGRILPRSED
jgi:hypothetical protein